MKKLLTTKEAADYLSVTPSRIRQYISESRLTSEKFGRDHFIEKSELDRFSKEGKLKRGRPKKINQ